MLKCLTKSLRLTIRLTDFSSTSAIRGREQSTKAQTYILQKLEMYKTFLKPDSEIRFKTDDDELFDESLEYFEQSGYEILYLTRDLHASDVTDNIETEHEKCSPKRA